MNRNHFLYAFYILVLALITGIGVSAFEAYMYRTQKEQIMNAMESAGYSATLKFKHAQQSETPLLDVKNEYYDFMSLIRSERVESLYESFPIFVIVQNEGYRLYAFGEERDYVSYGGGLSLSEENSTEITSILTDAINNTIWELKQRYQIELPYLYLEKGITIDMSESLVMVYVTPYNRFNNSVYAGLYQSSGQIRK